MELQFLEARERERELLWSDRCDGPRLGVGKALEICENSEEKEKYYRMAKRSIRPRFCYQILSAPDGGQE